MTSLRLAAFLALATLSSCRRASPASPEAAPAPAAGPPSTDLYLYRFGRLLRSSAVFNITNRSGYDNQPVWDGTARLLYTAIEGGQADIYKLDFETMVIGRVTDTPESEYSPALTPDGKGISVVRVERDSTQRLWRFPSGGEAPTVVLPNVKPVGYYAWLDSTTIALFVLGNPNTLQIADTRTGTSRIVTTNIGRSLQRVPGGRRAAFVQRVGSTWMLQTVDPMPRRNGTFDIDTIAALPDSADYVVWASPTELFTAAGSRILRLRRPAKTWQLVDDLSGKGVRRISRLALSPDRSRLALVADEPR